MLRFDLSHLPGTSLSFGISRRELPLEERTRHEPEPGCLWACAEGKKEMVSELQVYKLKAALLKMVLVTEMHFQGCGCCRCREGRGLERGGQVGGEQSQGFIRDSLLSCSRQIQASFVTPSLCCEQMLNEAGMEWVCN